MSRILLPPGEIVLPGPLVIEDRRQGMMLRVLRVAALGVLLVQCILGWYFLAFETNNLAEGLLALAAVLSSVCWIAAFD